MTSIQPKFTSTHVVKCLGDLADIEQCATTVLKVRNALGPGTTIFVATEFIANSPEMAKEQGQVVFTFHNDDCEQILEYSSVEKFRQQFPINFKRIHNMLRPPGMVTEPSPRGGFLREHARKIFKSFQNKGADYSPRHGDFVFDA